MKSYKHGELAKKILLIAVAGGAIAAVMVLPGLGVIFKHFGADSAKERYRVKRTVKRLEEQGVIKHRIKNGKEEFVVTKKGKTHLAELLVDDLFIRQPAKWDGRWRVLIYDIPNKKDLERRELNRVVSEIGMKSVQQSVFVSPYPCKAQIDAIARHYDLDKHLAYFEADYFEGANDLLNHFKLK